MTDTNKNPKEEPEVQPKPKKLTPDDPVSAEILKKFSDLEEARNSVAIQLLMVEQSRIRFLAVAHQIDEQKQRLFEQILVERGLPPTAQVEINGKTGALRVLEPPKAAS